MKWITSYKENGKVLEYSVTGKKPKLKGFTISDPKKTKRKVGTVVVIDDIRKNFPSLIGNEAIQNITEYFAPYLRKYSDVSIIYDGTKIDPESVIKESTDYKIAPIKLDKGKFKGNLTIVEWTFPTERSLHLCDKNGFPLAEKTPGIQARDFNFTAYLNSDFFVKFNEDGRFALGELDEDYRKIHAKTKSILREHFRSKKAEEARSVIEVWQEEEIYPFEGKSKNIIDETERKVFDICAINLNNYLDDFEGMDNKSKKFSLRVLKTALKSSPSKIKQIFQEVLGLPKEQINDLASLLQKTTLTAIINASKVVADRLDFITGLSNLIFNAKSKKLLKERKELHKILESHTWIFGEEFHLSLSDSSLEKVLQKHLCILRGEKKRPKRVKVEGKKRGIIDLLLTRKLPMPNDEERHYLIVELKRPSQKIDLKVLTQLEEYALAVSADERFQSTKTKWTFWAVSNEINDHAQKKVTQANREKGLFYISDDNAVAAWAKTWGQLIRECESRLKFFQKNLKYASDDESALAYLRETHNKYLPEHLQKK